MEKKQTMIFRAGTIDRHDVFILAEKGAAVARVKVGLELSLSIYNLFVAALNSVKFSLTFF